VKDPLSPARGAANIGAAGLGRTGEPPGAAGLYELGDVLAYNSGTHTAVVRTHSGRPLQDVPQIKGTASGYDHIPTGTTVVIFWGLGFPAILGCIDLPGQAQSAIPSPTLTGVEGVGDSDPTQPTQGSNNYKPPGAPTDMTSGDWAQVGSLGNHVAVLEGGVSLLGSPSAHVQSIAPSGTLRFIARQLQQFTDFGQLRIENFQGRTSLVLRAGSNQASQTGLDEQHWTIRLDLGATGDVLDFRILEPEGKLLFRLHAGSDGKVQIYGNGGVDISSGPDGNAQMRHDIAGARATAIAGDDTHTIQGNRSTTIDQGSTESVAGDAMRSVAGNSTSFVGGGHDVGVSGDAALTVAGERTTKIGKDDKTDVDGDSTTTATGTLTTEGIQIKHGANAVEPVIKGTTYGSAVMAPLGAAGAAASIVGATAAAIAAPDAFIGTPTALTITAVTTLAAGVAALGAQLSALAAAYASTLSIKVKTE
jgi:hypothetical protein